MNELSQFNFDEDIFEEIDFNFDNSEKKYCTPKKTKSKNVKYKNASKLSKEISLSVNERYFCIVDGSFIFGDFIEAFIVDRNLKVKELTLSTLSMSQENIDSLANLVNGGFVDKLNIIISDYFYSHERHNLIKYLLATINNSVLQLAVCRTHTKITFFETNDGKKIIMYGSANLRSSDNLEQFSIEHNEELYDFNRNFHNQIIDKFKTINKSLKNKELWQTIAADQENTSI